MRRIKRVKLLVITAAPADFRVSKPHSMAASCTMTFIVRFAALFCVAGATLYPTSLSSRISKISSSCTSIIKQCPLTSSYCASNICKICTDLGISPPLEPCCDAPTPTKCFANNYINGVTSTAASIPSATLASSIVAGEIACKSLFAIYSSCEAATPGQQQSCFCTTSGTFAPNYYDGYFSSCLSFASKYDPSEYSQLGPTGGGVVTGTFSGIGISHGLGSTPCHAWYKYTMTATPGAITSKHATPPPLTSTRSQGGQPLGPVQEGKVSCEQQTKGRLELTTKSSSKGSLSLSLPTCVLFLVFKKRSLGLAFAVTTGV